MDETTTVELEGLVKKYGSLTAVNGVSIQVREGEVFSLLGPSGCGKTTTLRSIAGFENPTDGAVYIDGRDVVGVPSYDRDTGMVFQGYALFPHKTVGENIEFGLRMEGVPEQEREESVAEVLELVDLPGTQDRSPEELSGGQQQRVALARALVIEPSVLLLDEPLANLDLNLRNQMRIELGRIQEELDITTIYVTHDQEEALSLSDRIAVMNDGEIEQIGSPVEIYNNPNNEFVADFIGEANLFDGRLVGRQNGTGMFELAGTTQGRTINVDAGSTSVSEDEPAILSVRPENIGITPGEASRDNALIGTVVTSTFLGKVTQYLIDVEGKEVMAEVRRRDLRDTLDAGSEVTVEWDQEDCLLISG